MDACNGQPGSSEQLDAAVMGNSLQAWRVSYDQNRSQRDIDVEMGRIAKRRRLLSG